MKQREAGALGVRDDKSANSANTREQARDSRRSALLQSAMRTLACHGVAETTTRMLAGEAQVNQATLRYYFGSKDDLLLAVLQELMRQTRDVVTSVVTPEMIASGADLRSILANAMSAFWAYVEREPELQMIQLELTLYTQRHPESAWLAREQYAGYVSVVETILRETLDMLGQANSVSFEQVARFLVAGFDGLTLQFLSDRDPVRARRDLNTFITAVVGLLATPVSSVARRESERSRV